MIANANNVFQLGTDTSRSLVYSSPAPLSHSLLPLLDDASPVRHNLTHQVLQRIGREVGRSIDVTIRRDGQAKTRRVTVVTESDVATKKST